MRPPTLGVGCRGWRVRCRGEENSNYSPLYVSALRVRCFSLVTRPSSLNPRLLRKQQLNLEAQLPVGTKLRTMHIAKRLQLRVDRRLRNSMALQRKYLA